MVQPGPNDYRRKYSQHTEGMMDQANELGERAQTLAADLASAVKARPYTTLVVAAGAAFAVGALWMISRQRPQTRLEALRAYMPELDELRSRVQDVPNWNDLLRRWWR
jgi:hypothetical protein